jgi:ribosomal protein S18 acetylase RimI-like enzyme
MAVHVRIAAPADARDLAAVAAQTFPLACPPGSTPEDIDAFITTQLSADRFAEYLRDPDRVVLAAYLGNRIIGYCILIRGIPADADVQLAVQVRPSVELSKMYVLPEHHGTGASASLMSAALDQASAMSARSIWLGVNQENARAQRFYAKHGFTPTGVKAFQLGDAVEHDYVMVRSI